MNEPDEADEADAIAARYARRAGLDARYGVDRPDVRMTLQERQRALLALFDRIGWHARADKRVFEVGCGHGANLVELMQLGFAAPNLGGVELLPGRLEAARAALPQAIALHAGDALALDLPSASQDAVLVATVFSSLLADAYQQRLADAIWRWVKPGGGVLWYDFTVNNPRNADVRGVPLARVRALFPHGRVQAQRVTLAPPLARLVTRVHPGLYTAFNAVPWLRTHLLAWVGKP
ncbi:MAG TPA: class I SAM-dependent methyltransferase [Burkholderiaceae bacterium]|nr:class I SAM-dependent methyltransferase [Burkholderiaceae bacterium]